MREKTRASQSVRIVGSIAAVAVIACTVMQKGSPAHLAALIVGAVLGLILRSKSLQLVSLVATAVYCFPAASVAAPYYPVLVSAAGFLIFGLSITFRSTVIERLAAIEHGGSLPPEAKPYCRKVNLVWVLFFLLNGIVAFCTARFGSKTDWFLYNGVLSYGIAAALFFGERIFRRRFIARNGVQPL